MTERIEFIPAVTLKRADGLYGIIQKAGLEALLATPVPETIVLPLNGGSSGVDYTGEEFVVELSTRGTTHLTSFLHLIVESRYSGTTVISFSQNQIGSAGGGAFPVLTGGRTIGCAGVYRLVRQECPIVLPITPPWSIHLGKT